ncbi:MAG: RNA polymerase sigma factor [bacterium]
MSENERLLIERARKNDMSAFREIVEQYKEKIYYLAYDLTSNRHDAEDIAQEVFIKAFRSLDNFRGDAKIGSWLYRITINTSINKKRKKALTEMSLVENFNEKPGEHDPFSGKTYSENPERSAESQMIQQHINLALTKLANKERSVFVLRHYQDLPLKEIAHILNIAEGTVKSLLFRAIRRLQKELAFYRQDLGLEESQ